MIRFAAAAFALVLSTAAHAQQPSVDHRLVVQRIVEDFVVPRYQVLSIRLDAQSEAWKAFCAGEPADRGLGALIEQFANSVNAWAGVELLRYGPVSEDFRYERIAYWPERKNDVARGLRRMLADDDPLTPETVFGKSVAVQGLSALERLLYEDGPRASLLADGPARARHCEAGVAISGNLANIARQIVEAWPALAERIRTDEALAREAATRLATDLLTIYQVGGDLKLDAVMGKSTEEAKPKAAQWWRSGLSSQTLALNLQSAADLTWIVLGPGDAGTSTVGAIETAQRLAEDLPLPLSELVTDEVQRRRVLLLRDAVRGARDLSAEHVPAALGIVLGFNSLDGD